ncbi:hypothetical protein ScPMuIL_011327 [Solemya velum]
MAATVFVFIFLSFVCRCYSQEITVNFRLEEDLQNNTLIGNIADESDLSSKFNSVEIGDLQFRIFNGDTLVNELFYITEKGGYLFTAKVINRDELKVCKYVEICIIEFEVSAQSTSGVKFITVKVEIEDVNDNKPLFEVELIKHNLSELVSVGTEIPIKAAEDKDIGINGIQSYKIWPPNSHFRLKEEKNIDGRSTILNLVVNQSLNREEEEFYELRILAEDGGTPLRTGTLTVQITVLDENDEKPVFTNSPKNITVPEDIAVNTPILKVTATDSDSGKNGEVFYRFAARQKEDVGDHLTKAIIYEPGLSFKIYVEASDKGDHPLFAQTVVDVYVLDSGNNQPEIELSFLTPVSAPNVVEISEGKDVGYSVAIVDVEDTDTGRNGNVSCSTFSTYFGLTNLGKNRYTIALQHRLNREDKDEHSVSVTCKDQGTPVLRSTVDFIVRVSDENDEPPIFSKYVYSESLMENQPNGTFVTQVTASDKDFGKNAEIIYEIFPHSDFRFTVEPKTGILRTNTKFDRENSSHVTVVVTARDNGVKEKRLTSSATVVLDIEDENDNAPEFSTLVFPFPFMENLHSGSFVGNLAATDLDKGENGRVTYSISLEDRENVPFVVLKNGEIKNDRALDRETQNRYDFTVTATDHGVPSLNSSAHVTIFVMDENDHAPNIIFPRAPNDSVIVPHVTLPNIVITSIIANDEDLDENADLVYSILGGNSENVFSIDSEEGNIYLSRKVELTKDEEYTLTIAVDDKGTVSRRSVEVLNILLKYSNVTTILAPEGTSGQNVLIAVVVVCLTVVLSIAMIAVICVIRKCDNKKASTSNPAYYDEADRANGIQLSMSKSKISHVQIPDDKMYLDKSKKKEVSFSFDEENNLNLQIPPAKPPRYSDVAEKTDSISKSNKPMSILRHGNQPHDSTDKQNAAPGDRLHEDSPSETSGETVSGDSGHGGSELGDHGTDAAKSFEINPLPHNERDLPSIYVIRPQNGSTRQDSIVLRSPRSSEIQQVKDARTRLKDDYSEDPLLSSHNSGWSVSSQGSRNRLNNSRDPTKSWTQLYLNKHNDNSYPNVQSVSMYSPTSHLYRAENIPLDHSVQSRDDDDVTTTSGSYTVNPDDLNDSFSPRDLSDKQSVSGQREFGRTRMIEINFCQDIALDSCHPTEIPRSTSKRNNILF